MISKSRDAAARTSPPPVLSLVPRAPRRTVQITFPVTLDDVDRSRISDTQEIANQMARDILAIRRSRIRYDRHALFDCGWDWQRVQSHWRAAARAADVLQDAEFAG